ncbi:MAG: hypothetical protein AAGI91_00775 [Bacteroidota bacterium]
MYRLAALALPLVLIACDGGAEEDEPLTADGTWAGEVSMSFSAQHTAADTALVYDIDAVQAYVLTLAERGTEGAYGGTLTLTDDGFVTRTETLPDGSDGTETEGVVNHTETYEVRGTFRDGTLDLALLRAPSDDVLDPPFASGAFRLQDASLTATLLVGPMGYPAAVRAPSTITLTRPDPDEDS